MLVKIIAGLVIVVLLVIGIGWLGLQFSARSFPLPDQQSADRGSVAVPSELPAPVERYAEAIFAGEIPIVESALIMGTGELIVNGIRMPARFKFYHDAGNAYYHYIQVTWFGLPVMTVNERYLDGVGILDMPMGRVENEPKVNTAAHQALWAEAIWLPSLFFTDERARWEPVDAASARLIIPDADPAEMLTFHFDPQTGLVTEAVTLRYQEADSEERSRWTNRALEWGEFDGVRVPTVAETQWEDDRPWAVWRVEQVLFNVDVSGRLAQFGGDVQD
jgi:hypothetical protein